MNDTHDLAIIGSGLAGLSAALQGARLGLRTIVIGEFVMGGQIVNADAIDNYPGLAAGTPGIDLVTAVQEQVLALGVEFAFATVETLSTAAPFVIAGDGQHWTARSVVIATGGRRRQLGVPGESALRDRGVSECATCDGPLYRDQEVAVVGGGDAAMDEALYLAGLCRSVHLLTRNDALSGLKVLRDRVAASDAIRVVTGVRVVEVLGDDRVTGVRLAEGDGDDMLDLDVSGVFVYIGSDPATEPFVTALAADAAGHLDVDLRMQTSVPGIFAAGACRRSSSRQLVAAAGDGVTAAINAHDWLRSLGSQL